jgi:uncharacterized protein YcaQ
MTYSLSKDELYSYLVRYHGLDTFDNYDDYIRVLAPLDNLLWDRVLVHKLFDFQYTWELYVPAKKRKYGYYVLPILYHNKIIARMEPVKPEPGIKKTAKIKNAIAGGLKLFARYAGAEGVGWEDLDDIIKK